MSLIKKYNTEANRKKWQAFLKTLGHDTTPDGIWGPKTTVATKNFQTKYNLTADGVVGENTLSAAMVQGFAGFGTAVSPVSKKVILISAGHTNVVGKDRGVAANGLIEGVEAVKLRDAVAAVVRKAGHSVLEDGADGINEPLTKAIALARVADLAIEFHLNAATPAATGIEVLSKVAKSKQAQIVAEAIASALGLPLRGNRGWKSDSSGQHSRLGFCEAGGLVVEVFFATNIKDVASYKTNYDSLVNKLGEAIAGI